VHPGLHRPRRHAEQARHLGLGEIEVEAEHQGGAVPDWELLQGLPQELVVAAEIRLIARLAVNRGMSGLDQRAAQQRPVAVDEDPACVRCGHAAPPQPPPGREGPRGGLLGELVSLVPVTGQQEPETPQRPILIGEEVDELTILVCYDG
jgi:hypothetical protein